MDEIAKQNKDLEDEIEIITNNRDSWKNKCIKIANNTVTNIRESISETHRVIEATEIEHKIKDIEELSVIEYKYKQTCVIDEKDTFNFFLLDGTENPFTNKKLVVSMVGKIKAGIEADKVTVETDSASKKIIIGLPASKILSNELDEDSFYVYLEEDTIFNRLKAQDHSALRQKINDESRQFAIDNGVLEQADERVHQLIRTMLEQIPDVKDYYTIEFKTV